VSSDLSETRSPVDRRSALIVVVTAKDEADRIADTVSAVL